MTSPAKDLPQDETGPNLYRPPGPERNRAQWRINGHLASVIMWSQDEWEKLSPRPEDAQYVGLGIWCALRLDE